MDQLEGLQGEGGVAWRTEGETEHFLRGQWGRVRPLRAEGTVRNEADWKGAGYSRSKSGTGTFEGF